MNAAECNKVVSSYVAWLRKGLSVTELDRGSCIIDTPFLDRRNDLLQVEAEMLDGQVCLHDRGDTLLDLSLYVDLKSPDFKNRLEVVLNGLDVSRDGNKLFTVVPENESGQGLHSLIQAMLAVEDMFMLARPQRQKSLFSESVLEFLESKSVRLTPQVNIKGKSGFNHAVDCIVPISKKAPERIVKAINAPNKNTISNYLFILGDTRKARRYEAVTLAVLNDTQREIKKPVIDALKAYQVIPAFWSKKEELVRHLAA